MENKKIQPAHEKFEEKIIKASDNTKRAEDSSREFEYNTNIYGRGIKDTEEIDPEIQKMAIRADMEFKKRMVKDLTQKYINVDEKIADFKRSKEVLNLLGPSIAKLREKINAGGILPVKKEELKRQLGVLEKIQSETKSKASLELSEIEALNNAEYENPKSPEENLEKN